MRTPTHWKNKNILSFVLCPFGWLYALATAIRLFIGKTQKVSAKVICVGNLTAGGTGKTPISISLAKILQDHGRHPFFVTRGYGGKLQNIQVNPEQHTASQTGDEPLLLARQAPVIVNHQRYMGAQKAISLGADTIIMDDGFQNPSLHKDVSFIVIDGEYGFGNNFCIPAGPLREFKYLALKRAQAIIIVGEDKYNLSSSFTLPVFHAQIAPQPPKEQEKNQVFAFAGIGRPQKFYKSLKECGFDLVKTVDFPDHHFYTEEELLNIMTEAKKANADIYTTSKDFVKIPSHMRQYFKVLEINITWKDPDKLTDFLLKNM